MNFDKRRSLLKHASVMRTRQIPGEVPDVGYDGRASPHAYAGPMGEPSAGRDEQVGQMFRNMRSAMGAPRQIDRLTRGVAAEQLQQVLEARQGESDIYDSTAAINVGSFGRVKNQKC